MKKGGGGGGREVAVEGERGRVREDEKRSQKENQITTLPLRVVMRQLLVERGQSTARQKRLVMARGAGERKIRDQRYRGSRLEKQGCHGDNIAPPPHLAVETSHHKSSFHI